MVNIPGRSRGCITCRKRKKGCDLQHPTCRQCSQAKISCGGYDPQRIFVNAAVVTRNIRQAGPAEVALRPSLARSAYEDKYFSLFWDIYLGVPSKNSCGCLSRFPIGSWRSIAWDLRHQDNVGSRAVLAMVLSTIGRKDEESWMMTEGLKLYVGALGEAQTGLRHPTKWKADSLLLACSALGMFELLYGAEPQSQAMLSQARSWHGHAIGEMALVQHRSPAAHTQGIAHQLFVNSRIHLTIAACLARKRSSLADPTWVEIPWSKSAKTCKDELVDVFIKIPGLLEDLDRLRQSPTNQLYRQFMADYTGIDAELTAWLQNQAPVQHLATLQARGYTSPTSEDLAVAQIMSLFWTISILAHSAMRIAVPLDPSSSPSNHLPKHTDPRQYCEFIADVVEVFFQPGAGIFGMQAVPFPVGIALEYLMSTEGYGSDVTKKLVSYLTNKGLGASIGNFIMSSRKEWMGPR